jgi:hypothetical protein
MEETPKRKRARIAPAKSKADSVRFLVSTKGYNETFDTLEKARGQFDILRKRAIKNNEPIKVQVFEKVKNDKRIVDEVNITEDYYD